MREKEKEGEIVKRRGREERSGGKRVDKEEYADYMDRQYKNHNTPPPPHRQKSLELISIY